jgi:protein TonB
MLPTPPKTGRSAAAKAGIGAALVAALALVGFVLVPHLHLGATTESQQAESSVATPVLRATETKPTAGQAVASATASESSPAMQASAPATEATPASAPAPVASAAPAPVVAPVTHTAQTGEVKGEVANEVLPEVLPKAQATISGTINIQVQVNVDPSGTVSGATLSSPESSKYFSKLALQAAQKWRFKPARVDGEAVASVWKLQFQFRQNGIDATPVEETP